MDLNPELDSRLKSIQRTAIVFGGLGAVAAIMAALKDPDRFYPAYLLAFVFWLGISMGSLAFQFIHHLAAGAWSFLTRRLMEAATRLLPLMALAFIPIIVGRHTLYEWTDQTWIAEHSHHEAWNFKLAYLTENGFIGRAVLYFAIWILLASLINSLSRRQDQTQNPLLEKYLRKISGIALLIYGISSTFASFDWLMSLEPAWFSSMFGPLFMIGQGLTTITFCIILMRLLALHSPFKEIVKPVHFHDLGNMAFAFTILWGYMSISQYLIVWCANLPEETFWFLERQKGGWQWVAMWLAVCNFFIPFFIMLFRNSKLQPRFILWVALWIISMRVADLYWVVGPTFRKSPLPVSWVDFACFLGVGGIWVSLCIWQFRSRPLLPQGDTRFSHLFSQQEH